ncbi:DUF1573 domain-containing protein [Mangrovivirga cuniculi]|uniref:DUF1573 domain-containing protein n=1 Tax=Mangrovivirga cuniculi TaxID=2715131 RepID=A0A4D7JIN9_9BACT|nr:DUF1573 domain-containing protein [Mangrovivirga cuniculi]QCK14853.1 hypothetical protein DCC35_08920 [Mangrovivirga cuniculi]
MVKKEFEIYNQGEKEIVFDPNLIETPEHITVSFNPANLAAKERGKLVVSYDTQNKDDLGYFTEPVSFITSEDSDSLKTLYVTTFIKEYFPPMTKEELADAPKISVSNRKHDFGALNEGETSEYEFTISNYGKEPLLIRKILANCGCIETEIRKEKIKPGQSTTVKVKLDSEGRVGYLTKNLTIFSNDPRKSTIQVTIKAKIDN